MFQLEELQTELESCKEALRTRLQEMNELNERNCELVGEVEKLKIDVSKIFLSAYVGNPLAC